MCAKKKHSKSSDFLHYLKDELSKQERHELERSLEADPFEREAMEGLQGIRPEKAQEDLLSLHASLNRRLSRRRRRTWYGIAATAASILLIGTIFLNIYDLNPDKTEPEVLTEETFRDLNADKEPPSTPAEAKESSKSDETVSTEKADSKQQIPDIEEPTTSKKAPAPPELLVEDDAEIVAVEAEPVRSKRSASKEKMGAAATYAPEAPADYAPETVAKPSVQTEQNARAGKNARTDQDAQAAKIARTDQLARTGQVSGVVVSAEDMNPLPGANLRVVGSNSGTLTDMKGRFTLPADDSQATVIASFIGMETEEYELNSEQENQLVMKPDANTLDEVVVVSSAIERKSSPTSATTISEGKQEKAVTHTSTEPEGGFKSFRDYVEEHMVFPEGYSPGERMVVILSFTVKASGSIENIETLRSPGEAYTLEAIRLIQEGPEWTPAFSESGPLDEQVRLRIVFKK